MPLKSSFFLAVASTVLIHVTIPTVIADEKNDLFDMDLKELLTVEITVASIRPATVFNSVSVVSTIDRQSIERYGYKSIEDALVTVSGFDVQRSYLKQSIPTSRVYCKITTPIKFSS